MKQIKVHNYSVKRLWNLCEDRVFAVPEIQREFVWDSKKACKLLDSLYRQLPIGTLLIWETKRQYRNQLRHAQEVLPPFDDNNKRIWFLIDGQQRLSVLHRAKTGQSVMNSNGREVDFSRICFSFDDRYEGDFINIRKQNPNLHIPIAHIFSKDWRRKLRKLPNYKMSIIRECRNKISNYMVPLIFIETSDLEEVRESFLRINSGGLRISSADSAFTRASRLRLRHLVNNLRANLPWGFNLIDRGIIQLAAAFCLGQREVGNQATTSTFKKLEEKEVEDGKVSKHFTKKWSEISKCVQKAIDFLKNEIGLPNYSFLPSDNMLATLSYFYYANNMAEPNHVQRREIRKWFWASAVAGRYTGRGYRRNILEDLDFFKSLGRRRTRRFVFQDLISSNEIKRTDYQVSSSLGTAFFLLLCLKNPKYLENGSEIPLVETAAMANRKDKHHIFPRACLHRKGFTTREANSLCNMCYIVADENQSIGSNRPAIYLNEFKRKRHFARVMKSHLIPYKSDSGLWDNNVKKGYRLFTKQRLDLIRKQFEKEAGIRLFRVD